MFHEWYSEKIKNLGYLDMQFIKLAIISFTLFIVSFLSDYIDKIVAWRWIWLALFVLFAIKPAVKILKKGGGEENEEGKIMKRKKKKAALELKDQLGICYH